MFVGEDQKFVFERVTFEMVVRQRQPSKGVRSSGIYKFEVWGESSGLETSGGRWYCKLMILDEITQGVNIATEERQFSSRADWQDENPVKETEKEWPEV